MDGYSSLQSRARTFLRNNPEIESVTLKRPKPKPKVVYVSANDECYGRMPETCPILRRILDDVLPETLQVIDGAGMAVGLDRLRNLLFERIHDQITTIFRAELLEVCQHKHKLMSRMQGISRQIEIDLDSCQTLQPPQVEESPRRRRSNADVEVEIEEDEGDIA